jgi:hypothetical protein
MKSNLQNKSFLNRVEKFRLKWILLVIYMLNASNVYSQSSSTITFDDQGFAHCLEISNSQTFSAISKSFNIYAANFDGTPSINGSLWYEDGTSSGCWTGFPTEIENGGYVVAGYATGKESQKWIDPQALVIKTTDGSEFKFTSFKAHDAEWDSWGNYLKITGYKNGSSLGSESVVLVSHVEPFYSTVTLSNSIFEDVDEVRITMDKDNNPAYGGEYTQDGLFHSFDTFVIEPASVPDSDGTVTSAAGVTEPVSISSTVNTVGQAVDVFDFTIVDGGTSDGKPLTVSQIDLNVSGTSTDAERSQVTWRLNGPDASNVTGTYNSTTDKITFSGLTISVPDGGNKTYTLNAYYNDNSNLTDRNTFILSVDGDTDFTVGDSGTQMGTTSAVTNGTGSLIDIVATKLVFLQQPTEVRSYSAFSTQPIVAAQDEFGNTDRNFTEIIALTESSPGTLSPFFNSVRASSGVATFTSVFYTATVDQEAFTLTANDQDGIGTNLPTVQSDEIIADVVATKLLFAEQPSPTTIVNSGAPTAFTTVPVVAAYGHNDVLDTGFTDDITIQEVNGLGTTALAGTGDSDANGATVTISPINGVATFAGLTINYTHSDPNESETFNLRVSADGAADGITTAESNQLTSTPNTAPVVENTIPTVYLDEDDFEFTIRITNRGDLGGELFSDAQEALNDLTFSASSSVPGLFDVTIENAPIGGGKRLRISLAEDKNGTTTITLRATDSGGLFAEFEFDVIINAVNDDPTFAGLPSEINLTEDTQEVFDVSDAVLADVDAGSDEVTVSFSNDIGGRFSLAAPGGIVLSQLAGNGTGTITLTGSIANIMAYLDIPTNIYFFPPDDLAGDAVGTITVTANDNGHTGSGGGTDVEVGTIDINITGVNDAPVLTASSGTTAFVEDASAVVIDDAIEVVDVDSGDEIVSATVSILGNYSLGNDVLSFVNDNPTAFGSISSFYDAGTGVLTLNGAATPAQYQAALRAINFNNTSNTPETSNRTIAFRVNDGDANSNVVNKTVSVSATNDLPVASNVSYTIGGDHTFEVGNALSVNYDYSDPENDDEQPYLTKWYASDDETGTNKTVINGAESPNYFLSADEVGKYISVEVTPYDGSDYGTPVESDPDGPVYTTPTVTTSAVTSITFDSGTFTGEVTSDGFNAVTERGFVYSTTETPTIDDSKIVDGDGTGEFTEVISDLDPNETYYVRSFATNAAGTVYGSQESFTTLKKSLTITGTFTAESKTYDGNTTATVNAENLTLNGFAPEQSGTIESVTYEFSQSDIGTGLTVSITELIVGGADAGNYTVSLVDAPSSTADITAKELTIGGSFTVTDKTYDGNTTADIATNSLALEGIVGDETVTLESFDLNFANEFIGEDLSITLSNPVLGGEDAGNYTVTAIDAPSATAEITAKVLTVGGTFTVSDKVYDGNTVATIDTESLELVGVVGDENVFLDTYEINFSQSDIGTGITVSLTDPSITGSDIFNYKISGADAPSTTADITAKELTIGGSFTVDDKTYDGNTSATIETDLLNLLGIVFGDEVTLDTFDLNFAQSDIGTELSVAISNPELGGTGAGNYTVTATDAPSTTADISAKEVSIGGSFTVADKVYDGSTSATIDANSLTLVGVVDEESVTLDTYDLNFSQSDIGTGLTVTLTNPTFTGADIANYTITAMGAPSTTADITAKELTIGGTITADNKIYDGLTNATLSTESLELVGIVGSEDVDLDSYEVNFSQSDIGSGLSVAISNPELGGTDAGNYTVTATDAPSTTATIMAKELTIAGSFTVSDKTYDGNTTAAIATNSLLLVGVVGSETVALSTFDLDFELSGIGVDLNVMLTHPEIGGADAGNYTVTATDAPSTTADITAKELTIGGSFTVADKTYDATATATLNTNSLSLVGIVGSETITLDEFDLNFAQSGIGSELEVSLTNPTITGTDAGNYTVTATDAPSTTANISAKELTIGGSFTASDKTYDGNTIAEIATNALSLDGIVGSETVTLSSFVLDFEQSGIGEDLQITLTQPELSGIDAGNYTVTATDAPSTTADITAKEVSISGSFTVADKVYDRNTTATIETNSLALVGVVDDEDVTLDTYDLNFSQSDVGTGLTVTLTNPTFTGADIANYTITATNAPTTTAAISPIELTIAGSITAEDKTYDGKTLATLASNTMTLVGVLTGETVELNTYDVDFSQTDIGTGLVVSVTNPTLTGSDSGNYTVTPIDAPTTTADITAKEVSIGGSFTVADKVYDGNTSATIETNSLTLEGVVEAESVTLDTYDLNFSQSDIGTGLTVTLTNPTFAGADIANYTITASDAPTATATISAKELTIAGNFLVSDKVYDGNTSATLSSNSLTLDGIVGSETVTLDEFDLNFAQSGIGSGLEVSLTNPTITGTDAGNYTVTATNAPSTTATIMAKELSIAGSFTVSDKTYNGNTTAAIATNSLSLVGVVGSETVTLSTFDLDFEQSGIGEGLQVALTQPELGGTDAGNYTITATGAPSTTADITAKELTIGGSFTVSDKTYDGTTTVTLATNNLELIGVVDNESVDLEFTAEFESKDIGTAIPVTITNATLSGSDDSNYVLSLNDSPTTSASINGKLLQIVGSFSAADKTYDGTNVAEIASNNLELVGVEDGDDVSIEEFTAVFESNSASTDVNVDLEEVILSGSQLNNYILSLDDAPNSSATIFPLEVALTGGVAADKIYDGSADAVLSEDVFISGVLDGESLVLSQPTSVMFDSEQSGANKTVVAEGYELADGANGLATNYVLETTSIELSASILPKDLTITAISDSQVFNNVPFSGGFGVTFEGFIESEDASILSGELIYSGNSQGATDPGVYELSIAGLQNPNYAIEFVSGQLIILDLPKVVAVSPEHETQGQMIDVEIRADFNVPVSIADAQKAYILDANANRVGDIELEIVDGNQLVIEHADLAYLTTYTVRVDSGTVVSEQNVMNSPFEWQFTTIIERPDQVVLALPSNNNGGVDPSPEFKWFTASRADEYLFELATTATFDDTVIESQTISDTTTSVAFSLDALGTYFWRVTSSNEGGSGDVSETWSFTTKAEAPTLVFPGMQQVEISTAPLMKWSTGLSDLAVDFVLATDTTLTTRVNESMVATEEFQINGLEANTKYFWAVRVNDERGISDWSEIRVFTTRPDPIEMEDEPVSFTFNFGTTSGSSSDPTSPRSDPQQTDYRMISLPGSDQIRLDNFFPGNYNESWRAFIETGDPIEFYDEYSPEDDRFRFTPGLGFWVLSTEVVADVRTFTAVQTDANDAYGISVHPGWNIIGNPFQTNVEWSLVTTFNQIDADLWGYDNSFETSQAMEPLKAYYFYNDPAWNLNVLYLPYTGFEQRGQDKIESNKIPESAAQASILIDNNDAEIGNLQWIFGTAKELLEDSTQYSKNVRSNMELSFNRPHPELDFAQQGAVIIQSENLNANWARLETDQFSNEDSYEIQIKAGVGQTLTLSSQFVNLPSDSGILILNKVTNQTSILTGSESVELKVTEPLATYQVHFGTLDFLRELEKEMLPQEFVLMQNYPNPFNPSTNIRFALPEASQVRLDVFDVLGRHVQTLVNAEMNAGWHTAQWNASNVASGVYIYRIQAGSYSQVIKMTLVK